MLVAGSVYKKQLTLPEKKQLKSRKLPVSSLQMFSCPAVYCMMTFTSQKTEKTQWKTTIFEDASPDNMVILQLAMLVSGV